MIEKISDNSGVSPAANLTQKAAGTKILCHTPFGDVMVDELSTPNFADAFSRGRSGARNASAAQPAAVGPAAQSAVAAASGQASTVPATLMATVAASAAQSAVAAASGQASAVPATLMATVAADAASTAQTATGQSALAACTEQAAGAAAGTQDADASSAPTAQSVFGSQPWLQTPTGSYPDGSQFSYNPLYFATRQTADQIAAMVGGQVVEQNALAPNGPIRQNTANEMIKLPNGTLVNAGLIAGFYDHGYSQSMVDHMIQDEIQGA